MRLSRDRSRGCRAGSGILVKYACCKHGPDHMQQDPTCGFAHHLWEVDLPERIDKNAALWRDAAHVLDWHLEVGRQGPPGIDMFFGQQYTSGQLQRVLACVAAEGIDTVPRWARHLAWFLGMGPPGRYVADGLFNWAERRARVTSRMDAAASSEPAPLSGAGYPFILMKDARGFTLPERMRMREDSGREFKQYTAHSDWQDVDGMYAAHTPMLWGVTSQQYLSVSAGGVYYHVATEEVLGRPAWVYMVALASIGEPLRLGGWAPPSLFQSNGMQICLYEVELPIVQQQAQVFDDLPVSLDRGGRLGSCQLHTDGSTQDGQGIAGGWIFIGQYHEGVASVAGPFTGSEASELLGIVGGLVQAIELSTHFQAIEFRVDNLHALEYVFLEAEVKRGSMDHWPVIEVCRRLLRTLRSRCAHVTYSHIASAENYADKLAYHELARRRGLNWVLPDVHPECMSLEHLEAFRIIGRNRASGRHGHKEYSLPSRVRLALGMGVLEELD